MSDEGWKQLYQQEGVSLYVAEDDGQVILREHEQNGKTWFLYIPNEHRQAVADALTLSPSSDLTVRIDEAGAAHLLALDDGGGCGITVPKDRRRAIGLEIAGGSREAMVERLARMLNRAPYTPWELLPEGARLSLLVDATKVVESLFGEPA